MDLSDIIKFLSTVLSCAVNKSQQHQEKNYWERLKSNLGLLGEKQVCYLCAMQLPISVVVFVDDGSSRIGPLLEITCFLSVQELAEGPLLSYDPLPPTNSIDLYKKSSRNANSVFDDPSAFRMFFRLKLNLFLWSYVVHMLICAAIT